jgi:hypothetical protein
VAVAAGADVSVAAGADVAAVVAAVVGVAVAPPPHAVRAIVIMMTADNNTYNFVFMTFLSSKRGSLERLFGDAFCTCIVLLFQ